MMLLHENLEGGSFLYFSLWAFEWTAAMQWRQKGEGKFERCTAAVQRNKLVLLIRFCVENKEILSVD